ncbi:MAG: pyridoxal-phosphate dependent enzyme, partial [Bacteroidota bacterium]
AVAHYESTGPEIWEQTEGKVDHFVVGVGTGGTISGVGKYLKEQNPNIKIWGIDTYGSVFKKYHETGVFDEKEIYPYITEGIGEDILPKNVNFEIIDHFEKVTDKDAAIYTRELARQEGIVVGNSAGAALGGVLQLQEHFKEGEIVVVLFHDHGSRYVGKMFNDDWMRERGFLDDELKVKDIIQQKSDKRFMTIQHRQTVREAMNMMKENDISQLPVMSNGDIIGSISERAVLSYLLENPVNNTEKEIESIMGKKFPQVDEELPVRQLNRFITKEIPAVIAKDKAGAFHIITDYDIIQSVG